MAARSAAVPLEGRRVLVPETRELDLLASMLEQQGATAVRCPLVSIHDAPDPEPVQAWLRRFADRDCDDLVLMTGEGLKRLLGFAALAGIEARFRAALAQVRKITRGPKPVRVLRSLGLDADIKSKQPTTVGVIEALGSVALDGRRVGVQLYPEASDDELIRYLGARSAMADPVLPYVYGSEADDGRVAAVIEELAEGRIDVIAFTSSPQIRRLVRVASERNLQALLRQGLARTRIATVGPITAAAVEEAGGRVEIQPSGNYHLKPLVAAIVKALQ